MKYNTLVPLFLFCLFFCGLSAQSYDLALGTRLGTEWGLSGRLRVAKKITVETILQSNIGRNEGMVTVLGIKHNPVLTRRFNVFSGAGLHAGWNNDLKEGVEVKNPYGVSLIGGIEFTLFRLNLSWDIKPAINLTGGERTMYVQSGLSIRYVMMKKNDLWGKPGKRKKKRRQRQRAKAKAKKNR